MLNYLGNRIYAIETKTSEEVARMFVRLQENYESPKFRNKVFTLKEFIKFYKRTSLNPTFTYYGDWAGFNIPGHIVKRFTAGKFNPLTSQEKKLLKKLKDIKGKYYLIGYSSSSPSTKKHEIAHGLFYTNKSYKKEVMVELENFNLDKDPVVEYLRSVGYHEAVIVDEFHAWVLTDKTHLKRKRLWRPTMEVLKNRLDKIYRKYRE